MPRGWNPSVDPYGGYRATRSFLGIRISDQVFSDSSIDKILKNGKDPKRVLGRQMKNLSIKDKQKLLRRIEARETKANQGKKR
jgi:hypothetical protein